MVELFFRTVNNIKDIAKKAFRNVRKKYFGAALWESSIYYVLKKFRKTNNSYSLTYMRVSWGKKC